MNCRERHQGQSPVGNGSRRTNLFVRLSATLYTGEKLTSALPTVIERHQSAYNSRGAAKVAEHYAEDATFQDPFLPQPLKGKTAVRQYHEGLFAAFPDFTVTNRKAVVGGHCAPAEYRFGDEQGAHSDTRWQDNPSDEPEIRRR